jgi:hypothetical protein
MNWAVNLPGQPPSGNHMYERNKGNAGQHKKEGIETYQAAATFLVRQAKPSGWEAGRRVVVNFHFFVKRPIDATNAMKVIEDAIGEALCPGIDPPRCCRAYDARFLCRAIELETGTKDPYVLVTIE